MVELGERKGREQLVAVAALLFRGGDGGSVRFFGEGTRTSSIVMTRKNGKVRFVDSIHLAKSPDVKVRFS